jgi:peptidoglycan/xylan/chitin deacetylase (PgdA/CDA1 family)
MRAIPILLYHSIDRTCSPGYRRWMVTPERFAEQMHWLTDAGFTSLTVSTLAHAIRDGTPLPPRPVAITFDDGLRDFRLGALPVLDRLGMCATLYVVAGRIGQTSTWLADLGEGDRAMLDWPEIRDLIGWGIECGAHTLTHPQLDVLPPARARAEIEGSKAVLEEGLGTTVETFAYPHGYGSAVTRQLVAAAGFTSACRVRHALSSDLEDPFCLSRIIVTQEMDRDGLMGTILGIGLPIAPPADRWLAQGWRMIRRVDHALRDR